MRLTGQMVAMSRGLTIEITIFSEQEFCRTSLRKNHLSKERTIPETLKQSLFLKPDDGAKPGQILEYFAFCVALCEIAGSNLNELPRTKYDTHAVKVMQLIYGRS
jgi:hypothetical protein